MKQLKIPANNSIPFACFFRWSNSSLELFIIYFSQCKRVALAPPLFLSVNSTSNERCYRDVGAVQIVLVDTDKSDLVPVAEINEGVSEPL